MAGRATQGVRATRGVVAALVCVLGAAAPASAAQGPLGEGAWSWFGDPRAVHHAGHTYVGWVDQEGDIKVSSFDHATGERVAAVLAARLNKDDHANPSIHVRSDGHLVVFYSRHVGPAMHYRVSSAPGDVTSWEPPQTVPTNRPGGFGYTYPNPLRLEAEDRTYLFWRGGNYNPTFSTQADGETTWSPARNLMVMPNERPYTKYAASGGDTIHVAYTNAHPNEYPDVNVYYARVRDGDVERAGGQQIGTLAAPIEPEDGDLILDPPYPTWVHDVAADPAGRPVILMASFPAVGDHRYHYARWTGASWVVHQITPAGGSFREDGGSPYYSGGLTLDHEDPSHVSLSRQVPAGAWQVETWTTADGGASWTSEPVSEPATGRNVRPVSPRGWTPFGGNLSVVWMRGPYPDYRNYQTSIMALADGVNQPPVADAEPAVRSGRAPLEVRFDGSLSGDPDGSIVGWQWDFGDGTTATGPHVTHAYTSSGRYFPTVTVTDDAGVSSTLVEEIVVGLPAAPTTYTGGTDGTTAHGAVVPENQLTQWYFEYGPTEEYGARTPEAALPAGDSLRQVSAALPGLVSGRLYHYRLVASNGSGSSEGADRMLVAGRAPGSDAYREAILATNGLASYWRLGELSGDVAKDERGLLPDGPLAGRFVLGQVGVLGPLANTATSFDGASGELAVPGPTLSADGTLEGWFRWRAGTAVMRDNTGPSAGWLLAFNNGGTLRYRVGGTGFNTGIPIEHVRDGAWHHLVATKSGKNASLYVDGGLVHSGDDAGATAAALPWHVMRNGTNAVFSEGEADEVALYARALSRDEVRAHHDLARTLAGAPPPPESAPPAAEPPAAGTGLGGGVLGPAGRLAGPRPPARSAAGRAFVRGTRLVVRGAAGRANRLTARRKGRRWLVSDTAAPLQAGAGCRRLDSRAVSCRAARVKRIEMYGGAGADVMTVLGRIRALLVGGPGVDRLAGGRLARFRGGPGADRVRRLGG